MFAGGGVGAGLAQGGLEKMLDAAGISSIDARVKSQNSADESSLLQYWQN